MRLGFSQQMRLSQQMKLSPRMIQAMEILQLPLMALQERIEEELSSNPVLELREGDADQVGPAEEAPETAPQESSEQAIVVSQDDPNHQEDFGRLEQYGEDFGDEFEWDRPRRVASGDGERDGKLDALANAPAPQETLFEHLRQQWAFVNASPAIKHAGLILLAAIDDEGYLRTTLEELSAVEDNQVTLADLKAALPVVQRLDPPGIGARDLRECLLIQLNADAAAGKDVSLERQLLTSFAHELELNHLPQIAKRLNRPVADIQKALTNLGRLDPRPGRIVGPQGVSYVTPDAIVDTDEEGNLIVSMYDGDAPALKISRAYRNMAKSGTVEPTVRDFVRQNLRSAQWLIGAIMQRRATVRRVIEAVFAAQKDFLEQGSEALKPLPMADVARKVGVHVATISRAVAGKHIQTPRGIFPLRMFFTGGTTTSAGQDVAWDAVKAKLKEVVDREDKQNPLDDDEIVTVMQQEGIKIARRTVAKYRNLLNIPPARQRKTY